MCFSRLSIISFIFNFSKNVALCFKTRSAVKSYGVFYMGSQSTITFGIKSILFKLCLCRYICCSLCTLSMAVSLMGTSGDSIHDICVVFFTLLIICELQGTPFFSHQKYGIPAYILCNAGNPSYVMRFHTHLL